MVAAKRRVRAHGGRRSAVPAWRVGPAARAKTPNKKTEEASKQRLLGLLTSAFASYQPTY